MCPIPKSFAALLLFLLLVHNLGFAQAIPNVPLHQDFEDYQKEKNRLYFSGSLYDSQLLLREGTKDFVNEEQNFYSRWQRRLSLYQANSLTLDDRLSLITLQDIIAREIGYKECRPELYPINQYYSWHLRLPEMAQGNGQSFRSLLDYKSFLNKMLAFETWTGTAIKNMREGIKQGVVLPRVIVLKVIGQIDTISMSETSVFYSPLLRFPPSFSGDTKLQMRQDYDNVIRKSVLPAYKKLRVFLAEEYLPAASESPGISGMRNGADMYANYIYYYTGLQITPQEIYNIGSNEFKRISEEISSLKAKAGFKGTNIELFNYMKSNPEFKPYKTAEEVLLSYKAISDRVISRLPAYFKGYEAINDLKIRTVPSYRVNSAPPYYANNTFFIPIEKAEEVNLTGWPMEALFLHEGIPGHHLQISLQKSSKELPSFRRNAMLPIFVEGWGLYSESLGDSLGCYKDIWQRIGAKAFELHRAIRLLVDVGLHTGKMTREDAIKLVSDNQALSAELAELEVNRYMVLPGQAVTYKLGEMKIFELRNKYQKLLGERFKLSDFHHELLKNGAIPFHAIEIGLYHWANTQLLENQ
ncbi:DUF885 domain-containing protein [Desertivirga brevis]|uniref:DUF885 domain-containing protein n=1 Tax=Desertivirga brevis TaxID=2810310 RepID=UPI001A959159|nr:DUF885 domain-containing protein [Pedobacter sp. SYSU D00873]